MWRITYQLKDRRKGLKEFRDRDEAAACWNSLLTDANVARVQVAESATNGRDQYWRLVKWGSDGEAFETPEDSTTDE